MGLLDQSKFVSTIDSMGDEANIYLQTDNTVVNQLFGTATGLGMGLVTFDWSQVAYIGSPMVIPWYAYHCGII